jgi:hypothetical protein
MTKATNEAVRYTVGREERTMRRSRLVGGLILCAALALPALALGQAAGGKSPAKAKDRAPRGVITLAEVTITGRIQKPIAAVDVTRLQPKLTLSERKQEFVARIDEAIYRDPF